MAVVLKGTLPSIQGNYFSQGLTVGPKSPPTTTLSNAVALRDTWGEGMQTGQAFTYRILPYAATYVTQPTSGNSQGFGGNIPPTTDQSIVAKINNVVTAMTSFPYPLTLSGSTATPRGATKYMLHRNNGFGLVPSLIAGQTNSSVPALQLDYPRCLAVTTVTDATVAPWDGGPLTMTVNIYGYDYYGQPMMETVTALNHGPTGLNVTGAQVTNTSKAFYGVTAAYVTSVNTGTPPTSGAVQFQFLIGVANVFGLPYSLNQAAHLIGYSQGSAIVETEGVFVNNLPHGGGDEGSYIFPTSQGGTFPGQPATNNPAVALPAGALRVYQSATPSQITCSFIPTFPEPNSTAITRDVRGLIAPLDSITITDPSNYILIFNPGDWSNSTNSYMSATYYVAGGDQQINEQINIQNIVSALGGGSSSLSGNPFTGMWRSVLDPEGVSLPVVNGVQITPATATPDMFPQTDINYLKGFPQYYENPPNA